MKLRKREKLGYGCASLGDAASYAFISTFLLFFLTTVAGVDPAIAGTITAVGAVCDMIWSPIVGYISDHTYTKMGRRRPFLLCASIPLGIACILNFTDIGADGGIKILYYFIMVAVFWFSFATFFNPYLAMGAEITHDYDERTILRAYAYAFNIIGIAVGTALPTLVVDFLGKHGFDKGSSWQATGVFVGVLVTASIIITFFAVKDKVSDPPRGFSNEKSIKNMLSEYLEVMKLRPLRILMACGFFFLCANTILSSVMMYFMSYNLGFSGAFITLMMLFAALVRCVFVPIVNRLSAKTDKRKAFILMQTASVVMIASMKFIPLHGILQMIIFMMMFAFTCTCYWQLMPSMIYDTCEVDELYNGKRREGIISSAQCFIEAISAAVGMQALGLILKFAGFNGEAAVQSANALTWIENSMTWLPAIFIALSTIMIILYPLTKEKFKKIQHSIKKRNSGEKLDDDDFII